MTTTAFLGTGTMGEALLKGSLAGGLRPSDTRVTARRQQRVDSLAETYGVRGTTDNAAAVADADIVVVTVPPEHVTTVLATIADHLPAGAVVISIADGVSLATLGRDLPDGVAAARAMPSLAAEVGHGVTLLTLGDGYTAAQAAAASELLGRSGEVITVDEDQHAVMGPLSSGGLAYFFYVADAMIEAGAMRGIARDVGRRLVAQVMVGSTSFLLTTDDTADELRARTCAPGGAGIRRIAELDARAVRAALVAALTREV